MTDLAERVFRTPVRLGVPLHLTGLVDVVASPMYSTAVGLVLHGLKQHGTMRRRGTTGRVLRPARSGSRHRVVELAAGVLLSSVAIGVRGRAPGGGE